MAEIFEFVEKFHGHWRWLVALVAVVALVKFLIGWLSKGEVQKLDKQIGGAFAIVMTVQFVLGLVTLVGVFIEGSFNPRYHGEHLVTGLIAVGLSHTLPLRKDDRPSTARFRTAFIMTLVSLVLAVMNVIIVRGGWMY